MSPWTDICEKKNSPGCSILFISISGTTEGLAFMLIPVRSLFKYTSLHHLPNNFAQVKPWGYEQFYVSNKVISSELCDPQDPFPLPEPYSLRGKEKE